jgi:predicted nucleic acid-binding protein
MSTLVIDTNILISALIKDSTSRSILTNLKINFIFPQWGIEEIYLYKYSIMKKAGLTEKEFDILLLRMLKYVRLIPADIFAKFKQEADRIIEKIDKNDSAFIATALAFNCPIWSEDRHFKRQNKIKVITTKDMISYLKQSEE